MVLKTPKWVKSSSTKRLFAEINAMDSASFGPSAEELVRLIKLSGESEFVDAKGPIKWDGCDASASLAKDIAAFANSRDGGILVIGKTEREDGKFELVGVSPQQAASFDTTVVGQWINSRFSPPIHFVCYLAEYQNLTFVVIVIQEFDDIPSICTKSFQSSTDHKKHLLREGAIYIRNQNAESKPLVNADELRSLVGLATKKRSKELLAHFDAMLQGRSLATLGRTQDLFADEIEQVQTDLKFDLSKGGWWMAFHPQQHNGELWASQEELEQLISSHSVRVYDEYPGHTKGTFPMAWGIANDFYGETWALTKSGLFCFWKEFRENSETAERTGYRGGDGSKNAIPPGEWIEYTWSIRTMVEYFLFLSRFVESFKPGEEICLNIEAGPLVGRKLVALSFDVAIGYGEPEPCRAPQFTFGKSLTTERLQAAWEPTCVEAINQFVKLFPNHRISIDTLPKWVERFKRGGY